LLDFAPPASRTHWLIWLIDLFIKFKIYRYMLERAEAVAFLALLCTIIFTYKMVETTNTINKQLMNKSMCVWNIGEGVGVVIVAATHKVCLQQKYRCNRRAAPCGQCPDRRITMACTTKSVIISDIVTMALLPVYRVSQPYR
jgi:hypothetical protein